MSGNPGDEVQSDRKRKTTKSPIMKMKTLTVFTTMALTAGSLFAADAAPKDEVTAAAKALGGKSNYSWKTTVAVPADAQFRPGPTEGKTEKDGFTHVTMSFFDNPVDIVLKGGKGAYKNQDGNWVTAAEAENEEGPGRWMARLVQNMQTPDKQAAELAGFVTELKKDGDAYVGELTEAGAKTELSFRREANDPSITNAKGSAKFWVKDGVLSKFEFHVKGTVDWNGNSFDSDRTTTVEIKEVGTTKLNVPEGAKQKLS